MFHDCGFPLRTFCRSTCQEGKPMPGRLLYEVLLDGVTIQRLTQAVVLIDFGLLRRIKPVTRLCSVASCKRRDCLKFGSRMSVIAAVIPSQRSASSVVYSISFGVQA